MLKRPLQSWRFVLAEFVPVGFGRLSDCAAHFEHGAATETQQLVGSLAFGSRRIHGALGVRFGTRCLPLTADIDWIIQSIDI